jgi:predicted O-methyltransferase YrrM
MPLLPELFRRNFELWQSLGLHVTRVHFYHPIPDTRRLPPSLWERRSEMVGVDMREAEQVRLLATFRERHAGEYGALPRAATGDPLQFHLRNGFFEAVDAEILYCTIRHFRPKRIVEIGSGQSTLLAAQAARLNAAEGHPCRIEAIEPYPSAALRAGVPGVELHEAEVQAVPLSRFTDLEENDILFIDSSHVLRIGGDVQYEFLEILPRLRRGVLVQVHDVFLPAEYPRAWVVEQRRFWNEQYLLQAFLAFNRAFEVQWGGTYMHLRHPELLRQAFPSYDPARSLPGSFWIRRTA